MESCNIEEFVSDKVVNQRHYILFPLSQTKLLEKSVSRFSFSMSELHLLLMTRSIGMYTTVFTESALRRIQSESRDVRLCVCLFVCVKFISRPLIGPQVT